MKSIEGNSKPLLFLLPTDAAVLAAVGAIALRHGQLDNALCLTIGSIAGVSREAALLATARLGSKELRTRLRKLAQDRFKDGAVLVQLDAILEKARQATDERNVIVHSVWARELDGDAKVRDERLRFQPAPSLEKLEHVAADLNFIREELLLARHDGFLAEAIKALEK